MIPLVYRVLLRFYPREFRERFGDELLETANLVDRGPARHRWRAFRDAVSTALAVRSDLRQESTARQFAGKKVRMSFVNDLRFALRGLRREPRFALFVVATLAVAIGANATLLGLADRLILRGPESIDDARAVFRVQLSAQPPDRPRVTTYSMGHVLFAAIRDRNSTGLQAASYAVNPATLGRGAAARPMSLGYGSPEFFALLGTKPLRGRFLEARDSIADGGPVVISVPLWQREFGGDDNVLGRTLVIDDLTRTVVGIAPRSFTGVELGRVDAWLPITILNTRTTAQWETAWNAQWLQTVVRVPADVPVDRVEADLTNVLRSSYTGQNPVMRTAELHVLPLTVSRDRNQSTDARILRWLFAVSGLVFLVACANVMSLLLARGAARRREVGVRLALGASRAVVIRQFLMEAGLLAGLGTMAGLGVAALLGEAARLTLFESVDWTSAPVNLRVIAGSALIAIIATVLTGLLPALSTSRVELIPALRGTARDGGLRRSRLRGALTIAQAAISVVLLVGAGLFIRSLWNARTLDLGVDADRVVIAETTRPRLSGPADATRAAEQARRRTMLRNALPAIRTLPGVEKASVAIGMPFGYSFGLDASLPGSGPISSDGMSVSAVTGDYFDTVGTRIIEGRAFTDQDREGSAPVLIVSAHLARQVWQERSPLGACLIVGKPPAPCATVVGVAADTHRQRLRESPVPHVYLPAGQESGFGGDALLIRSAAQNLDALADAVRQRLAELDSTITLVRTETLQERIDPQLRSWKLGASVFLFAGGLALLVASAGIYSVLSYLVAARRHEIGVRLALGASTAHVGGVVVRTSLVMAVSGIAAGVVLAAAIAPRLEPLLFDVSPRDPWVFASVAGLLTIVSIATSLTPALRASRVSPLEVLRTDI
jgi:predicted permease